VAVARRESQTAPKVFVEGLEKNGWGEKALRKARLGGEGRVLITMGRGHSHGGVVGRKRG